MRFGSLHRYPLARERSWGHVTGFTAVELEGILSRSGVGVGKKVDDPVVCISVYVYVQPNSRRQGSVLSYLTVSLLSGHKEIIRRKLQEEVEG